MAINTDVGATARTITPVTVYFGSDMPLTNAYAALGAAMGKARSDAPGDGTSSPPV